MRMKLMMKLILPGLIPLFLMGCWSAEEITDRQIVLAAGFDQTENGRIRLSLQVPIVEELLPIFGSPQVNKKSFAVLSAEGEDLFEIVPALQSKTQSALFFGQLKTVLIEEEMARKGLTGIIDSLRRHPRIPPQAHVVLVRDDASTMLNHSLWHKRVPGSSLIKFFHIKGKKDQAYDQPIWVLARNINLATQDAFLPILEYDSAEETYIIKGLGVFHNDRLVGKLSGEETRMFGLLSSRARNAYLNLTIPEYGRVGMRQVRSKAKIGFKRKETGPVMTIDVKARGSLGEITKMAFKLSPEDRQQINGAVSAYLKREMEKTLQKLQALGSDLLALGEVYRIHNPMTWEASLWESLYPRIPVELTVQFTMENYGVMR